jgi:hypothetical protein
MLHYTRGRIRKVGNKKIIVPASREDEESEIDDSMLNDEAFCEYYVKVFRPQSKIEFLGMPEK